MSQVKVQGNASGTGIFTIESPNSNSNVTFTLPTTSGTVLTNSGPYTASTSASNGAVTIDASNNVGIGTGSPGTRLDVQQSTTSVLAQFKNTSSSNQNGNVSAVNDAGTALRMQVFGSAAGSYGMLSAGSPAIYTSASELNFAADNASGVIKFSTGSSVPERARIDSSGNLLVNTTAQQTGGNGKLSVAGGSGGVAATLTNNSNASAYTTEIYNYTTSTGAGSGRYVKFAMGSTPTQTGSIIGDGTNTAYNTSSDYRLKENVAPMTGALALVMQQRPVTWTWKTSGKPGKGFIAHWLQEDGAGECVSGEKDAVDADGNPEYQGVDTSFLVATLTAAIQELNAKVEAQAAEIAALKGAQ